MEEIEADLLIQDPCGQVGPDLPNIIVELMPSLKLQQGFQPRWKSNIVEMESLNGVFGQLDSDRCQ